MKTQKSTPKQMQRLVQKGEKLYQEKIKKQAQEKYLGKYMMIEIDSGQYFIADTSSQALEKAEKKFPDKMFYGKKIGFPAVLTLKGFRHQKGRFKILLKYTSP